MPFAGRKPVRVGIFAPYFFPFEGGAERVVRHVAERMAEVHEVTVFTLKYLPNLPDREVENGVLILRGEIERRRVARTAWTYSTDLLRALRRANLDVLQIHGVVEPMLAAGIARAARRMDVPTILVPHGVFESYYNSDDHPWWRRSASTLGTMMVHSVLFGSVTKIAALSAAEGPFYRRLGVPRGKVCVVGNGFDEPAIVPGVADRFRRRYGLGHKKIILHLGNIKPTKGHFAIIDALPSVTQVDRDAIYVAVGDTSGTRAVLASEIVRRAEANGLAEAVLLTGHLADQERADAYAAADLVVVPSLVETMPLSLLDAMARAKPVVATRVGGVGEVLKHGVNGILVEPGDVEALAGALISALADPGLRRRLGFAARETVMQQFSWQQVLQRYEELQASLLADKDISQSPSTDRSASA